MQVLTDRHIREEVVPGLSVHKIMLILERFQPDDYAPDPLPHGANTITAWDFMSQVSTWA